MAGKASLSINSKGKIIFKKRGNFHPIKFEISVLQEQKKKAPDKLEKSMPQT